MGKNLGASIQGKRRMNCLICYRKPEVFILDYVRCPGCGLIWTSKGVQTKVWGKEDFTGYFSSIDYYQYLFSRYVDFIQKYKKKGCFLDIGCSIGTLLSLARKRGFRVYGVERSTWAANYCRKELKMTVYSGEFEKLRLPGNYFDVIVINHVLEHMWDPLNSLKKMHRILKLDGILLVGVPNIESIMFTILGSNWPGLQAKMHVWQFNKKTLTIVVEKSGFRVIKVWSETGFTPHAGWLKKLKEAGLWLFDKPGRGEGLLLIAKKE